MVWCLFMWKIEEMEERKKIYCGKEKFLGKKVKKLIFIERGKKYIGRELNRLFIQQL